MFKKIVAVVLVIALTAAASIAGTMAYLQDDDSDVNVMTLGNVKIDQIEQEWNDDKTDLKDFTQAKPLYPYVGEFAWETTAGFTRAAGTTADAFRRFTMNNVVDKYVSVKNTGKSDAYVRTYIALEMGEFTEAEFNMVGVSINAANGSEFQFDGTWVWNDKFVAEINGENYYVMEAVHLTALKPGETTIPSLLQVYLSKDAGNEEVEKLDGNGNGTYDILVLSQGVQTAGFEPPAVTTFSSDAPYGAEYALDTAFGKPEAQDSEDGIKNVVKWFSDLEMPVLVSNIEELIRACKYGGNVVLADDLIITDETVQYYFSKYITAIMADTTLDLNGHDIVVDVSNDKPENAPVLFYVYKEGVKLTVIGDGNVVAKQDAFIFFPRGVSGGAHIYGGNYYNNDDSSGTKNDINAIGYSQNGKIHIYGGTFSFKNVSGHCGGFNVYDNSGAEIVLHEGVLLSNENYYTGSDSDEIHLAEGCILQEVVIDGETWYQVVKN